MSYFNPIIAALLTSALASAQSGVDLHTSLDRSTVQSDAPIRFTIEFENTTANLLANVDVVFEVLDSSGASALADFVIGVPDLLGINAVDGSASLAPGASASAHFAITPNASAAVIPSHYNLQVNVLATLEGSPLLRELPLRPLLVIPAPKLEVELYWPKQTHGDWSSTPLSTESQEPFSVGAVIRNTGSGTASSVELLSTGPRFALDPLGAPGLAKVLELEVDGAASPGGFSIPSSAMGDIAPGGERRLIWTASANLEGSIADIEVSLLSAGALINAPVTSEVLVHALQAFESGGGVMDDGRVDWLVNQSGIGDLPSHIRFSDGTSTPVVIDTSPLLAAAPSSGNLTSAATTTTGGPGWNYLRFADPGGAFFGLAQVTRTKKALNLAGLDVGDGGDVSRVWTTTRSVDTGVDGIPDQVLREVHIIDFMPSAGIWEFGLTYVPSGAASLVSDVEVLHSAVGGTQHLALNAGIVHAGEVYILLGSLSGTSPGVAIGPTILPLNFDAYMLELASNAGLQAAFMSVGVLDGAGQAAAQIVLPLGFNVGAGFAAHHAFLTVPAAGPITFTSNAVVLYLLP